MTDRENIMGLLRKTGYEFILPDYSMAPDLARRFQAYCDETGYVPPRSAFVRVPYTGVQDPKPQDFWRQFYDHDFKEGTTFDHYGVAQEPGSEDCLHMTQMYHPLENMTELEELKAYPFPKMVAGPSRAQLEAVEQLHREGRFAMGNMQCTVWETAWYARGMEVLMMDMMTEPELADFVLDVVTENAIRCAVNFAQAGVDGIFLGDDVGMQHTIMMSRELYCRYLKPRLKRVIDAARQVNPELIVFYHSDGYITPFIPDLIEIGVDVLNPIQPECMDVEEIIRTFGDRISFLGTLGTQTLMPFGTPEEIRETLAKNLALAGKRGGLLPCPTHILEPEVPIENVIAYFDFCKEYRNQL